MVYHPPEPIDATVQRSFGNFCDAFCYREGVSGWVANEIVFSGYFREAVFFHSEEMVSACLPHSRGYKKQKVIEKLVGLLTDKVDLNIIRRIQAKEMIFCNVLTGRRPEAIRQISAHFKGSFAAERTFLRSVAESVMAFFIPTFLSSTMVGSTGSPNDSGLFHSEDAGHQ